MAVATFDTLKYARALKSAGVPSEQAEAQSEALHDAMQVNLKDIATKDDLRDSETRLTSKLENVATQLQGEITLLKWMLGVNVTVTVGVLVKLLLVR